MSFLEQKKSVGCTSCGGVANWVCAEPSPGFFIWNLTSRTTGTCPDCENFYYWPGPGDNSGNLPFSNTYCGNCNAGTLGTACTDYAYCIDQPVIVVLRIMSVSCSAGSTTGNFWAVIIILIVLGNTRHKLNQDSLPQMLLKERKYYE